MPVLGVSVSGEYSQVNGESLASRKLGKIMLHLH